MVNRIEAGTIELTLRDAGGIDLVVALYARTQNVSREAARQSIVQSIRNISAATMLPDAEALRGALVNFIETPGQTLNIRLTPLGQVKVGQLRPLLNTDPMVALAQFQIEASTGL